jgi:hypothetical protein
MRAELNLGSDLVGLARDPLEYRVRFWGDPPQPGYVRTVEEWCITEFDNFQAVQLWAQAEAAGRDSEVFAVLVRAGAVDYVRISGADGDADSGTSETILFTEGS